MKADECQIYTDVAGIHAADPRLVPEAVKLNEIGYDEMLEMAGSGAKVMHSRAVELAELYNMPILVASSFGDQAGTIICKETAMEQKNRIRGIAHDTNVASITVQRIPDIPGIAAKILGPLAKAGISVDTIIKNTSFEGITDFTFTVGRNDLARTKDIIDALIKNIGAKTYITDSSQAKVSIIGTGMQNAPGYAALMFQTLYENDINIQLISTSEIKITCIISEEDVKKAVQALYASFEQEMVKSTGM
jgi:aspartate kinase